MATGSAHNTEGYLKKNDIETIRVLLHLEEKIRSRRRELVVVQEDIQPDAETLVIRFGVTARAMGVAVRAARGVRRVVVAEENITGQYRMLIRHLFDDREVVGVNGIGKMIIPTEILHANL
ncbi:MAG: hypothetical protein C4326_08915 [Ignavibacteria bacterium]